MVLQRQDSKTVDTILLDIVTGCAEPANWLDTAGELGLSAVLAPDL